MKYLGIVNGIETLLIIPETEKEKEIINLFRNMGECTVTMIDEKSSVLDTPTNGALKITKIKKDK